MVELYSGVFPVHDHSIGLETRLTSLSLLVCSFGWKKRGVTRTGRVKTIVKAVSQKQNVNVYLGDRDESDDYFTSSVNGDAVNSGWANFTMAAAGCCL